MSSAACTTQSIKAEGHLSRISMLRRLGAPVIEPPGKHALKQSTAEEPFLSLPLTVLTRLWTVE